MATLGLIEYQNAGGEVRAVYDDIMATRQTDRVNNFWKAIAHEPALLRRTWQTVKEILAPGALDALTKEMIYVAVSVTNQCGYCIASHTAGAGAPLRMARACSQRFRGGCSDPTCRIVRPRPPGVPWASSSSRPPTP